MTSIGSYSSDGIINHMVLYAGGGEYPTQDGFGWANGVMGKLVALYPADSAFDRVEQCPVPRGQSRRAWKRRAFMRLPHTFISHQRRE
jgi:hypothetical protein